MVFFFPEQKVQTPFFYTCMLKLQFIFLQGFYELL